MKKRTLALALASLMLLSSCSSGTGDELKLPHPKQKVRRRPKNPPKPKPKPKRTLHIRMTSAEHNYNGESFGIMTFENQNFHYAVTAEEMLALPINDAMYKASTDIEDRFNRQREKCFPKERLSSWICRSSSLKSFAKWKPTSVLFLILSMTKTSQATLHVSATICRR